MLSIKAASHLSIKVIHSSKWTGSWTKSKENGKWLEVNRICNNGRRPGGKTMVFRGKCEEKHIHLKEILAFTFWYFHGKKQILKYTFHWRCAMCRIPSSLQQTTVIENSFLGTPPTQLLAGHRDKKHVILPCAFFIACTWKSIVRFFSALDGWTWFGALECRRRGGPMMTPSPGFIWRLPARLLQRVRNSWGSSNPESSRMHSGKDPLLHRLWTGFNTELYFNGCYIFLILLSSWVVNPPQPTSCSVIHSNTFCIFSSLSQGRGDFVSFPSNQKLHRVVLHGPPLPVEQAQALLLDLMLMKFIDAVVNEGWWSLFVHHCHLELSIHSEQRRRVMWKYSSSVGLVFVLPCHSKALQISGSCRRLRQLPVWVWHLPLGQIWTLGESR